MSKPAVFSCALSEVKDGAATLGWTKTQGNNRIYMPKIIIYTTTLLVGEPVANEIETLSLKGKSTKVPEQQKMNNKDLVDCKDSPLMQKEH
jgi:hypothetical protein